MNRERILRMASVAGVYIYEGNSFAEDCYLNLLDDVAAAAAAEEREECAKIAEDEWMNYAALEEMHQRLSPLPFNPNSFSIDMSIALMSKHIADLIRDRGGKRWK